MSTRHWAVFRQRETEGELHVMPADADGFSDHLPDVLCLCRPIPEPGNQKSGKIIVVHNEPGMPD